MNTAPNRRTPHTAALRNLVAAGNLCAHQSGVIAAEAWETALTAFRADGLTHCIAALTSAPTVQARREYLGDLETLAADLRRHRRNAGELAGAGLATLHAIHHAGGWHTTDPDHRARIDQALQALAAAVQQHADGPQDDTALVVELTYEDPAP